MSCILSVTIIFVCQLYYLRIPVIICYDQRHSRINRLRLSMQLKDLSMTTVSCPLNCFDYYLLLCVNFLLYLRLSSKLKLKEQIELTACGFAFTLSLNSNTFSINPSLRGTQLD